MRSPTFGAREPLQLWAGPGWADQDCGLSSPTASRPCPGRDSLPIWGVSSSPARAHQAGLPRGRATVAGRKDTACQAPDARPQAYRLIKWFWSPQWPSSLFGHITPALPALPWHPGQRPHRSRQPSLTWAKLLCPHQAPALAHRSRQPVRGPPGQTPRLVSKPGPQLPPHRVSWGLCPPSLHSLLNAVTALPLQGCLPQSGPPS